MAKATTDVKVTRVTSVTLELTAEEAGALLALTGMVEGSNDSCRKHTSAVYRALDVTAFDNKDVREAYNTASRTVTMRTPGRAGVRFLDA
ncbi:hypothetical protein ACIQ7S_03615 [Streptomyces griseoluteus]|uniref:hypothetical protein n=1 Tax=Streptomyces griseoluteus TaxID=29306 RepID=UPI00332CD10A